ncbi:MAG: helix-turn-helix transcriptional regulator [Anaerolineaceae bacterium]|nr:helix-turn-helix transcriptional regulator [Anaerolineaceae bacterium]
MSTQILATKLYIPVPRPGSVVRSRLIDRLNMGLHGKLALISAPAGFGKTTLVTEWIASDERKTAWLSLDDSDSDPVRFMTHFIAALQTIKPLIGTELIEQLYSPQPPSINSLMTPLLNELAMIPHEFVLVLDDYHVLDNTEIDSALTFLIDNQPQQMYLVITTREDPRLPLARLRVRGQLSEFRAADLRFTSDEAAAFLNRAMGLSLSPEDVAALEKRTEGWIAGLQLAAISMQGQTNPHQFVESFTGSHRFIVDYLIEEVLNHQPDAVRKFLFQTSILDRMSAPLCDAITGRSDGHAMLEQLERANMLIVPLDDQRQWYRYHHLFADVLKTHARKDYSEEIFLWFSRASQWHEENGLRSDAVQYALAANDFEQAANLIELSWPFIAQNIRPPEFLRWVEKLSDEIVEARPVLLAAYAWALLDTRNLDAADLYLKKVENWLKIMDVQAHHEAIIVNKVQFKLLAGTTAAARTYLALTRQDNKQTIYHAQRALTLLAHDQHYWIGLTSLFLGLAQWADSDLDDAYDAVTDSIEHFQAIDNLYFQVYGTVVLAEIHVLQGKLRQAHDRYHAARQLAQSAASHTIPMSISFYVGLGALYLEWNDLEAAEQHIHTGTKALSRSLIGFDAYRLSIVLAQVRLAAGQHDDAMSLLAEAAEDFKPGAAPNISPPESLKARFLLKQGRLDAVLDWIQKQGLSTKDVLHFSDEFDHITLARVKLAQYQQQPNEHGLEHLLDFLERLRQTASDGGRAGRVLEILILQALAYAAKDDTDSALEHLNRALAIAEAEGYIRIFVDEGETMQTLLARCLLHGKHVAYVKKLLDHLQPHSDNQSPNQLLIEPLSERELDVLNLMANGHTNQAIADELFIALSTVKKHINNIYGKLNVPNRTQAINRARDLGILS